MAGSVVCVWYGIDSSERSLLVISSASSIEEARQNALGEIDDGDDLVISVEDDPDYVLSAQGGVLFLGPWGETD